MILKLGTKYQAMELYKVCINHDPGMTLTFLWQGQLRANGQKIYVYENILGLRGCIYMYMTKILKHLLV